MSREDALHWAVCEAVACLNIGEDYQANYILRTALVEYADAPQAQPAEQSESKATPCAVPAEKPHLDIAEQHALGRAVTDWEVGYSEGWNECRAAMLAATREEET